MENKSIRVVIAHPHPVIVRGLSSALEAQQDFRIIALCTHSAACIEAIRRLKPHITIAGVSKSSIDGLDILDLVRLEEVSTRVVLFTSDFEERDLRALASAGAHAILPQSVDLEILVQVLRQVAGAQGLRASGRLASAEQGVAEKSTPTLTDRERQIMRLVSEGLSNKEIGRRLNLTDGTIKVHLHHIFQKLELSNRTALATFAISYDNYSDSALED